MNAELNPIDDFEKELRISLDWQEFSEEYQDIFKRYLKVPVKGFRPGATPASVIESMFKTQLANDLVSACATRFCRKALKENNLEAGSPIEVNDANLLKNKSLSFKARFIEMPKFDLPDYANLNIEATDDEDILNEISEKLIEQTIVNISPSMIEKEIAFSETENNNSEDARQSAEERVKLMLILKKIGTQDNIEVNEKDVETRVKLLAEENEISAQELKDFLLTNGGWGRLSDSLLAEHVLAYIKELNLNKNAQ